MTDAAEAELREIRKLWDEMQYIRTGAINCLFAHIDALAAEVERLKEVNRLMGNELNRGTQYLAQASELRALVREATQLIVELDQQNMRWPLRRRVEAWLQKANV